MTTRDPGGQDEPARAAASGASGTVSREADYQVGRKVEQVVSGAGGVARINVAVMLRGGRDQDQLDRIRDLVALAAGADKARGDAVSA